MMHCRQNGSSYTMPSVRDLRQNWNTGYLANYPVFPFCRKSLTLGNVYELPFCLQSAQSCLTVSLYLFLLKPQVFHLGWILEAASHPAPTISMSHWWAPIKAKQLSVALPSFVGWLGGDHWLPQIGLRAPLAMVSVFTDLVQWRNIQCFHFVILHCICIMYMKDLCMPH